MLKTVNVIGVRPFEFDGKDGKPVKGTMVTVIEGNGKIIKFSSRKEAGEWEPKLVDTDEFKEQYSVEVSVSVDVNEDGKRKYREAITA